MYSSQKQTLVIPEMTSEANSSHSPLFLGRAMEEFKFTNFENSYEINKNSYEDDFFRSGDQEKKEIYISKKDFWGVSGTWIANI